MMNKNLSEVQLRNVRDKEKDKFLEIKSKFGYEQESDLYSLCAAIGLQYVEKNPTDQLPVLNGINAWHASSIKGIKLFEALLTLKYPDDDPKQTFEKLFYKGFLIITSWWNEKGQDCKNEIDRFTSLFEYLKKI